MYDPCIGECTSVQGEIPSVPLVLNNQNLFNFNASFISQITDLYNTCGYKNWTDTYLTFPPPAHQPPFHTEDITDECDLFDLIFNTAFTVCWKASFSLPHADYHPSPTPASMFILLTKTSTNYGTSLDSRNRCRTLQVLSISIAPM